MNRLRQQMEMPLTVETRDDRSDDLLEHAQVHRTIDELIAQAAMKTRDAVREKEQTDVRRRQSFFFRRWKKLSRNTMKI